LFSSRRRHTRFKCDWSSDVCSSDLVLDLRPVGGERPGLGRGELLDERLVERGLEIRVAGHALFRGQHPEVLVELQPGPIAIRVQIGRASCRERAWRAGAADTWQEQV